MDNEHEKRKLFYSSIINRGDLCFDVGANIGNRTGVFLELGATVIAIEPQHDCAQFLRGKYEHLQNLIVIEKALGVRDGREEIYLCNENTIASMSTNWIHQVKSSGRFAAFDWNRKTIIDVTTLDQLISNYGMPAFCKIDVEGYEYQVLLGLTKPIPFLSFEFTKEHLQDTLYCINRLSNIGSYRFNLSLGESMEFVHPNWLNDEQFINGFSEIMDTHIFQWGDVYAKLVNS